MLRFVRHSETTLFGLCILLEIPGLLTNCTGSTELGPFTNVPVPLRVDALSAKRPIRIEPHKPAQFQSVFALEPCLLSELMFTISSSVASATSFTVTP